MRKLKSCWNSIIQHSGVSACQVLGYLTWVYMVTLGKVGCIWLPSVRLGVPIWLPSVRLGLYGYLTWVYMVTLGKVGCIRLPIVRSIWIPSVRLGV